MGEGVQRFGTFGERYGFTRVISQTVSVPQIIISAEELILKKLSHATQEQVREVEEPWVGIGKTYHNNRTYLTSNSPKPPLSAVVKIANYPKNDTTTTNTTISITIKKGTIINSKKQSS